MTLTLWPGVDTTGGSFGLQDLTPVLLIGSLVFVVCVAAVKVSDRTGLPSLLAYLGVGLAFNALVPNDIDDPALTQVLGYCALILILIEGGLTTRWSAIKASVAPAAVLATVGVIVSIVVVASATVVLLGWSWTTAFLVGAILTSTDAAAVFSVLRSVPLPRRVTGMLEAEAGFNDAPVVIAVTALSAVASTPGDGIDLATIVGTAVFELAVGAALGLAIGWGGGRLMRRVASGTSGLFSLGIVAIGVLAFAAAASIHASGFIACYLAALVLGNSGLPHRSAVEGFSASVGWLAQIGLFVLLGIVASPSGFATQLVPAVVLGLVLLLLARPLSVLVSLTPFRVPLREQAFLSWAGLRGAVPVVLATVPITAGVPDVEWVYDLVLVLVVVFTLVQGPLLPFVARRLRVLDPNTALGVQIESAPLETLHAELIQVEVGRASLLHGLEVHELRLPQRSHVSLLVRDGDGFVPRPTTRLEHGDQLLVVAAEDVKDAAEQRIVAVGEHGRLAGWDRGGDGSRRTYTPTAIREVPSRE